MRKVPLSIIYKINDLVLMKSTYSRNINSLQIDVNKVHQKAL